MASRHEFPRLSEYAATMTDIPSRIADICARVADRLSRIDGIEAVALGGSWSRGTARADSDIDLGLAYDGDHPFSIAELAGAARELDDRHLDGLVTPLGAWGIGVNGGGWLLIDGNHVDFLYRDLNRVREVVERCVAGQPEGLYQLGHPLGFQTQIYVGETHFCRPIFDRDGKLGRLKAMVAKYPERMRVALVRKHLFDSAFHLEIADKPAARADIVYVTQCLATATGFMTLVLYALNRQFFMNEKGAFLQSAGFRIRPPQLHERVDRILAAIGAETAALTTSVNAMREVHRDLAKLCRNEMPEAELESEMGALWRE
jgi:predicted nucleotidyltransferase